MQKLVRLPAIVALAVAATGCSTVMEANRPAATNLSRYALGESRVDIVAKMGMPSGSVKDGEHTCDVYKVYTKGTSAAGKGAIILGEAAADFFTLGLAEAITTPGEAVSKANMHTVLFCYGSDGNLAQLKDEGRERDQPHVAPALAPLPPPATGVGQTAVATAPAPTSPGAAATKP